MNHTGEEKSQRSFPKKMKILKKNIPDENNDYNKIKRKREICELS